MLINDVIFGEFDIGESILQELIQSKEVQRLKGIQQQGMPPEMLLPNEPHYTRYEHSVGVMLLLRKFGAGVEEQAAGLVHDVSHTAFSHLIDYVIGDDEKEDYQDKNHESYFRNSSLPDILRKSGYDPERVMNPKNYGLLEREIPDLCADRLESVLRYWHYMGRDDFVEKGLEGVSVLNNEIVCSSQAVAKEIGTGLLIMHATMDGWGQSGADMAIRWYLLAKALKIALDNGTISRDDFSKDDDYVISKLKGSGDFGIKQILNLLMAKTKLEEAKENPDFVMHGKFRYVDPKILVNRSTVRLSDADPSYGSVLSEAQSKSERGVWITIPGISK